MNFLIIFSILISIFFIFLFCYCIFLVRKMFFVSTNMSNLLSSVNNYCEHLDIVYNMDTFFGEPVLENLLKHTKDVMKDIKEFEEIYSLFKNNEEIHIDEQQQ